MNRRRPPVDETARQLPRGFASSRFAPSGFASSGFDHGGRAGRTMARASGGTGTRPKTAPCRARSGGCAVVQAGLPQPLVRGVRHLGAQHRVQQQAEGDAPLERVLGLDPVLEADEPAVPERVDESPHRRGDGRLRRRHPRHVRVDEPVLCSRQHQAARPQPGPTRPGGCARPPYRRPPGRWLPGATVGRGARTDRARRRGAPVQSQSSRTAGLPEAGPHSASTFHRAGRSASQNTQTKSSSRTTFS